MKTTLLRSTLLKSITIFALIAMLSIPLLFGQSSHHGDIGAGAGLSYGGFGTRFTYRPVEQLGLFGSLGYNLDALGYNLGVQYHVPSQKRLSAYLTGMYGYNTVLIVDAVVMESKTTYFGFSTGAGIEFKLKEKSFLSAELLVPFRPQAYKDAVDDLESISFEMKDPLPVAFCIGYHLKF
ncbi:hypothetical protein OU798_00940 [Prolixibacteraceae bacterium Z1-6]|uniref:Outer membrane protein beta-barrel domain-containing protein n=1 Tax=Draconibacterium aestuarii TaxID=2998507 RepID=A0A9X3F4N7_9BACT|nr:hypothetical protein [Prolixibacteraceae bacterium Z1-6]